MTFSRFMSMIGAAAVAFGGVAAAVTTLPVWVGPALAGIAYFAGHMATSPLDAKTVVNAAKKAADIATENRDA